MNSTASARPVAPQTKQVLLTGHARTFAADEIIVSKTDLTGRITYANRVFCRVAGFAEHELLGQPHSIIRHPDMPRSVFKLLWDTIAAGREIFAYVINRARNGDHYWVFAHVTPTFDESGAIIGYHSNRRVPRASAVEKASKLYQQVIAEERKHSHPRAQAEAGVALVLRLLADAGVSYDEFVFAL